MKFTLWWSGGNWKICICILRRDVGNEGELFLNFSGVVGTVGLGN